MAKVDKRIGLKPGDDIAPEFPQLRLPNQKIADSGIVRLGNGMITATFPELRLPGHSRSCRVR